jgi:hypothetical protein
MNRPVLEVADLVRAAGDGFIERSRRWIRWKHVKVLRAIARCRTAALGGRTSGDMDKAEGLFCSSAKLPSGSGTKAFRVLRYTSGRTLHRSAKCLRPSYLRL